MRPFFSKIAAFLKPKRRWFQFSLRTLLLLTAVFAFGMGMWSHRARQQKQAVTAILELGGSVYYDYHLENPDTPNVFDPKASPGAPKWLRAFVADEYFHTVVFVSLRDTTAADDDLQVLCELPRVENLDLTNTKITGAGLAHLRHLTGLKYLGLWQTQVDDAGLAHIAGLTKLQTLMLDNTKVTYEGMHQLQGLANIEEWLGLCHTGVTDQGLEHFRGFKKLRSLNLRGTGVTAAGVERLKRDLPNTDISFDRSH